MALEDLTGTGKFVAALNPAWPVDDDWVDEGDNHIRGVKNVLKNTFPVTDAAVYWSSVQARFPDGSLGAPGVSWVNEPGTGFFRAGTEDVRLGLGGQLHAQFTPAFTAFYRDVTFQGTVAMGVSNQLRVADGTLAAPAVSWVNEPATGFFRAASQDLRLGVGGQLQAQFTAAGTALYKNVACQADVTVAGKVIPSGTVGLDFSNTAATHLTVARGNPASGSQHEMSFHTQAATWSGVQFQCSGGQFQFWTNGQAWKNDGSSAWSVLSDIRLKKNVAPLQYGLAEVIKLEPITFEMVRADTSFGVTVQAGIAAQNAQAAMPLAVRAVPDGEYGEVLGMTGDFIQYAMVNAIKELSARVSALEAKLAGN